MKNHIKISAFILLSFLSLGSFAQSLSVGLDVFNDYYRRQQLLGNYDSTVSFTIRPLYPSLMNVKDVFDPTNSIKRNPNQFTGKFHFAKDKGLLQILPVQMLNQFNSHHPEGINDGSMIPAKGLQTYLSTGFYLKLGFLEIKFQPEFIYAQNKDFPGFPSNYTTVLNYTFPDSPYSNIIDYPVRFGENSFKKAYWGQSSIQFHWKGLSIGISNENLWWGPGYRNSLLMTNSAPGFMHLSFNTIKPLKTPIGNFEWQLIGGRLEKSGFSENLGADWRYINALNLVYQPKWVPGLFLGINRSFVVYHEDMGSSLGNYLPVFIPLSKKASGTNSEVNSKNRNQLASIYMRWIFPASKAEIYFEYGREDHAWDMRDIIVEPSHSIAYNIGLRKLISLSNQDTHLQLILEISNFASNQATINRSSINHDKAKGGWYTHTIVRHGYTHNGQILGSGMDPGSNLQTFELSWIKELKQIGLRIERYIHNNDFWFNYIKDIRSNWVDISYTAFAHWDYKHFIFSAKLKFVKCYNYQWLYEPEFVPNEYWLPGKNTFNFHGQLGVIYRF